jgi:3-oxoacyl-[acyl-carrier-protein] synthase-3
MVELIHQAEIDCREMGLNRPDALIPHQVNQRIIDAALEDTGFPKDKVMVNLCQAPLEMSVVWPH